MSAAEYSRAIATRPPSRRCVPLCRASAPSTRSPNAWLSPIFEQPAVSVAARPARTLRRFIDPSSGDHVGDVARRLVEQEQHEVQHEEPEQRPGDDEIYRTRALPPAEHHAV